MLLDSSGGLRGTIGGGCGEAEVYELGRQMLERPAGPKGYLCHVDLTENPEDGGEKVCGGRFDVLLTRWDAPSEADLLDSACASLEAGRATGLTTSWSGPVPGFWRDSEHVAVPLSPQLGLDESKGENPCLSQQGEGCRFQEPLGRQLRLVIVGAGHIARPLCRLANEVGYQVSVLDDRPEYARAEFFAEAREVVCGAYAELLPRLASEAHTSVVLVTRGHKHDQDCLRLLAREPLLYLGMIGSRRRIEAVYAELEEEGVPRESLERVHAPIGLEIGAQTPAEIAVSILAQMIARRRQPEVQSRSAIDRKSRKKIL